MPPKKQPKATSRLHRVSLSTICGCLTLGLSTGAIQKRFSQLRSLLRIWHRSNHNLSRATTTTTTMSLPQRAAGLLPIGFASRESTNRACVPIKSEPEISSMGAGGSVRAITSDQTAWCTPSAFEITFPSTTTWSTSTNVSCMGSTRPPMDWPPWQPTS
jgi:hypothetical protein